MLGFGKITAAYDLLKKGNAVADPALWKARQIKATAITSLFWAAIKGAEVFFGIEVPVDDQTVDNVAIGVLALVNWLFTLSTSEKVGAGDTVT